MSRIKTIVSQALALTAGTAALGVVLFACIPQAGADPWWTPLSMRSEQYQNRPHRPMPASAASGVPIASGVAAAPGILRGLSMAPASSVAASGVAAPGRHLP